MFTETGKEPLKLDASKLKRHDRKRPLPEHIRAKLPKRPGLKEIERAMNFLKPIILAGFSSLLLAGSALAQPSPSPSYVSSPADLANHRYDAYPNGVWAGQPGTTLEPLFFRGQPGACPGGADGRLKVSSSRAGGAPAGCFLASFPGDVVPVVYAGAKCDGVTDDTVAIQRAINSLSALGAVNVTLPVGECKITDVLTLGAGQGIIGQGRFNSTIRISSDFNLAAAAVVNSPSTSGGNLFRSLQIFADQPNVATKGGMIQYPPLVKLNGPRTVFDDVRFSGAWDAVDATATNAGAMFFTFVEIGAINRGIQISGAQSFVHAGVLDFGFFGFSQGNRLTAYLNADAICWKSGEVDGLDVQSLTAYNCSVQIHNGPGATISPDFFGTVIMDGGNRYFNVSGGREVYVGQMHTKALGGDTVISVTEGSSLEIGYLDLFAGSTSTNPAVSVTGSGSRLTVYSGTALQTGLNAQSFYAGDGARLKILNTYHDHLTGGARTVPDILVEGASTRFFYSGNKVEARKGGATGTFLQVVNDNLNIYIANNDFQNWTVAFPTTILNGEYGPNKISNFTSVPTVSFATNGTFAPVYDSASTVYTFLGARRVHVTSTIQFDTNAYTGASGAFQFTPTLPFAPAQGTAVTIAYISNVTFSGYVTAEIQTSGHIQLRVNATGAAAVAAGTTQIPANTNDIVLRVEFVVRY
jgi:hypothetical protein